MQNQKFLVRVSEEELSSLKKLEMRKLGLLTLSNHLKRSNKELYDYIVDDLGETEYRINEWWEKIEDKYGLENQPGVNFHLDFKTGDLIMVFLNPMRFYI